MPIAINRGRSSTDAPQENERPLDGRRKNIAKKTKEKFTIEFRYIPDSEKDIFIHTFGKGWQKWKSYPDEKSLNNALQSLNKKRSPRVFFEYRRKSG